MAEDDKWERLWKARIAAAESAFGPQSDNVLHATIPFSLGNDLGGSPDVVMFPKFLDGTLYMTADLIGDGDQPPNSAGQYELAIAHFSGEEWGVRIICQLAYYTLESVIEDGETMDIETATPEGSMIAAFLFRRIATFQVLGEPANVICCVGITAAELDISRTAGSSELINKLGQNFLVTDLRRSSVV